MNKLRSRVTGFVLAVTGVSATLLPMGLAHASPKPAASPTATRIAASTLGPGFRATLTAVRGPSGGGGTPAATVTIAVYERSGGEWKLIGRQTVGHSHAWFWDVVTGEDAICQFSTSSLPPYPIQIRLLVTDSLGCSAATYNFHVDKYGALVPG